MNTQHTPVQDILAQVHLIQEAMGKVMKENEHYGCQHTPAPWYKNGTCIFAQKNPGGTKIHLAEVLRDCGAVTARHNALMIVQAVNSHQQLVEACEAAEVVLSAIECTGEKPLSNGQTLDMIRSALATATGHLKGVQK